MENALLNDQLVTTVDILEILQMGARKFITNVIVLSVLA